MENKKNRLVEEDTYSFPGRYRVKIIALSGIILLLGFTCHISVSPRIEQMVAKGINQNRRCPVYYNDLSLSWITMSLKLKKVLVSGRCWGSSKGSLFLDEVRVGPGFPGIWPPGLKLNVNLKAEKSLVRMSFLWGIKKALYIRRNSYVSSDILNTIIGQGNILMGNIFMQGSVGLKGNRVGSAHFALQTKHLGFLPKSIRAGSLPFTLPSLNVAPVMIEGRLAKKKLEIESLRLGNPKGSPLFVDFKGALLFNSKLNRVEDVDLEGDLKIADELLKGPLSVLNLFWNIGGKPKKGDVYRIKFSGPFPKALTKPEFLK